VSRPYTTEGRGYRVATEHGYQLCDSRRQAGHVYTVRRSAKARGARPWQEPPNYAASSIFLRGTTDALRGLIQRYNDRLARPAGCPCCGSKDGGPLRLTDAGRARLARLRLQQVARFAMRHNITVAKEQA
jgi:hypothetical protein